MLFRSKIEAEWEGRQWDMGKSKVQEALEVGATTGIVWEDPPARSRTGTNHFEEHVKTLATRPGQWARIGVFNKSKNSAWVTRTRLTRRYGSNYEFKAALISADGDPKQWGLYGRFVGGGPVSLPEDGPRIPLPPKVEAVKPL